MLIGKIINAIGTVASLPFAVVGLLDSSEQICNEKARLVSPNGFADLKLVSGDGRCKLVLEYDGEIKTFALDEKATGVFAKATYFGGETDKVLFTFDQGFAVADYTGWVQTFLISSDELSLVAKWKKNCFALSLLDKEFCFDLQVEKGATFSLPFVSAVWDGKEKRSFLSVRWNIDTDGKTLYAVAKIVYDCGEFCVENLKIYADTV